MGKMFLTSLNSSPEAFGFYLCASAGEKKIRTCLLSFWGSLIALCVITMGFISFATSRKRTALALVCPRGGLHRLPGNFRSPALADLPISCEVVFFFGWPQSWERWPGAGSLSAEPQCHLLAWAFFSASPPSVSWTASVLFLLPPIIKSDGQKSPQTNASW